MRLISAIFLSLILAAGAAFAQDTPDASEVPSPAASALAPFEALMGTWEGAAADPEGPGDIMRFEWILGGAAVQHTHALADGSYGGRAIYFFDPALNEGAGGIIYHYFTTAGFHTQGTAWWEDGAFYANEAVAGHPTITEVESRMSFNEDGTLTSESRYLDNGAWTQGHSFRYEPAPDAAMTFPGN